MLYSTTVTKKRRNFVHTFLIRNHRYGDDIENSSKKKNR